MLLGILVAVVAFVGGFVAWSAVSIGGRKRCPEVYSAAELKNWHISEKVENSSESLERWRPARACGYSGMGHLKRRIRISWRVFCGDYDVVNWGKRSGEAKSNGTNYRDILDERRELAHSFNALPKDFKGIKLIPEFEGVKGAPKVGIAGTFIFGGSEFVIQAVDVEALRWLIGLTGIDLDESRLAEVMVVDTRGIKKIEAIPPVSIRAVYPGKTTGVTQ